MDIKTVMVVGAGQMGSGIAQVCAQAGYEVYLNDLMRNSFKKGSNGITKNLNHQVEKERLTEKRKRKFLNV